MQTCLKIDTDTLTQCQYCLLKDGVDNLTVDIIILLNTAVSRFVRVPSIESQTPRTLIVRLVLTVPLRIEIQKSDYGHHNRCWVACSVHRLTARRPKTDQSPQSTRSQIRTLRKDLERQARFRPVQSSARYLGKAIDRGGLDESASPVSCLTSWELKASNVLLTRWP
jgi:hypothetical protein